jgi:hypothetical protein
LVLLTVAAVTVWLGVVSRRHTKASKPIADLAVRAPLNLAGGSPAPAGAYEVYSALYQTRMPEPLAFAEYSITDIPQVNGSCLRPAGPLEQEMAADFTAANQWSHRWEQKFSIPQGYQLLPQNELAQAQTCLAKHSLAQCADYKQLRYVRLLGVPGFDHAHTHALVSVIKSCGSGCGSGGIFTVEKINGTWQRSAPTDFTRDCSWMY